LSNSQLGKEYPAFCRISSCFWKIPETAWRRVFQNPILGFFSMNRLAAEDDPPSSTYCVAQFFPFYWLVSGVVVFDMDVGYAYD